MLKQNTAITARRCSTAITLVLRRPNTQIAGKATSNPPELTAFLVVSLVLALRMACSCGSSSLGGALRDVFVPWFHG